MGFTLSGGTIIQSGTDNDLSGLVGIAGVSVVVSGSGSGAIRYADIGNLLLQVTGTLNHNPSRDVLIGSRAPLVQVTSTGHWNYGAEFAANGITRYTTACGLISTATSVNGYGTNWFRGNAGGRLTHKGGIFRVGSGSIMDAGFYYDQYAGEFESTNSAVGHYAIVFFHDTQANAERVVVRDLALGNANGAGLQWAVFPSGNASPTTVNLSFKSAAVRDGGYQVLRNFAIAQNLSVYDWLLEDKSSTDPKKAVVTNFDAVPNTLRLAGNRNGGLIELRRDISLVFTNFSTGLGVDPIVYYSEQDDGNRRDFVSNFYATPQTHVASASSGTTALTVTTGIIWALHNVNVGAPPSVSNFYEAGNRITFTSWDYSHTFDSVNTSYIGLNTLLLDRVMFTDQNVTLTKAQASALTQIDTLDQLYDAAKNWKCQPLAARIEYPTIQSQPVSASGNLLDLGSQNLVIDGAAAAAFAIDAATSTITIKSTALVAGSKFYSLRTTGSVSFVNGGSTSVNYTDASGVTVRITSNTPEFGFYGEIDGTPVGAYESGQTSKSVQVQDGQTLRFMVGAHGYKTKYLELTTTTLDNARVILDRDGAIDITIPQETKDSVGALLGVEVEGTEPTAQIAVTVSGDGKGFTSTEFLSGFDFFLYQNSQVIAPFIVAAQTAELYNFFEGGITNFAPNFYARLDNSVTTQIARGYYVPLVFEDGAPGVVSIRPNTSGLLLGAALWTKSTALISTLDVLRIQNGLATKAHVTTVNNGVKKASLLIPHHENL